METPELKCAKCGRPMAISRFRCEGCELVVEGRFELPPLARLSPEEQAFVTAFLRVHGNIRRMEGLFGISYPTVKNRLNAIVRNLDAAFQAPDEPRAVLDRLAQGKITVDQALEML